MVRPEFVNEAFTDFSIPSNHEAMTQALAQVSAQFDKEYPVIINGEKITVAAKFQSFNPGNTAQAVGTFQKIDRALTQQAIEVAHATFATWSKVPAAERAEYLASTPADEGELVAFTAPSEAGVYELRYVNEPSGRVYVRRAVEVVAP
jgi:1-pyrroline-5-carboxylate dehydrogenase